MPDTTTNLILVSLAIRLVMWSLRQNLIVKIIKKFDEWSESHFFAELLWCDVCLGFWVSGIAVLVLRFYPVVVADVPPASYILSVLLVDFLNFVFWTGIKLIFGASEANHA